MPQTDSLIHSGVSIKADTYGLYHPGNEQEIIELVQYALANKRQVRVRGAAQSVDDSIYTDGFKAGVFNDTGKVQATGNINIMLDKMRSVTILENSQAAVQTGCNLGFDPYDPSHSSTEVQKTINGNPVYVTNGLFDQLQAAGLAIPNVTDAINQTVGGFISTGSAAGTMSHSFLDAIIGIRLIDGTGTARIFDRPVPDNPDDPFYAVGVSMGLLGIITEVTFQCIPSFNVVGLQTVTADTTAPFDFFGGGSKDLPSFESFLSSTEFTRVVWWPFPTVKRLIVWQARTMQASDYNQNTGTQSNFIPRPYRDPWSDANIPLLTPVLNWLEQQKLIAPVLKDLNIKPLLSEMIAAGMFTLIGNWHNLLSNIFGNYTQLRLKLPPGFDLNSEGQKILDALLSDEPKVPTAIPTNMISELIEKLWPVAMPVLVNCFIPLSNSTDNPPEKFWDIWSRGLSPDTFEYSTNILPSHRTEFWISIDQAEKVMGMMKNYYENQFFLKSNLKNNNYANACYMMEIMPGKSNLFWLSPGYQQDSLRICFYSLKQNDEDIKIYFRQFYDHFFNSNIDFRLHWGYFLPEPQNVAGANYLPTRYPKWNEFLELRRAMDPNNIFLTTYWKEELNIS